MLVLVLAVWGMGWCVGCWCDVGLGGARGCSLFACVGRGRKMLCKRFWRPFRCGVACVGIFGLKVSQIAS